MRNGEFLKYDPLKDKGENHLVDDLIPAGQIILMAGLPGEGKSFCSIGIAFHIAYVAPFLGKNTSKGSVLIIDSENPKKVLIDRIKKIKKALEDEGSGGRSKSETGAGGKL